VDRRKYKISGLRWSKEIEKINFVGGD
jgi:hypothetical protein